MAEIAGGGMGAQVKTAYATLVGDVVSDRYRVVGEVGRTDFGVLYLAEDVQTPGRSVAINVLMGDLPALESERRRFEFETESLARRGDIDLTDFINAGRLPDGRPFWVLACQAIVPHVISPEQSKTAVKTVLPSAAEVGRRLERYEIVPVYRRQTFVLGVYALPVLLAVIASVGAKVAPDEPPEPRRVAERRLTYALYAQRYAGTLPVGVATPVELPRIFTADEHLRMEFSTPEEGYLYVVRESAPSLGGTPNYTVLFPAGGRTEQAAYLNSTRPIAVPPEGDFRLGQDEHPDRIWLVWSAASLDAFSGMPADDRLDTTQITAIQQVLGRRAAHPVKAVFDAASQRTQVTGHGDLWVLMLGLGRE